MPFFSPMQALFHRRVLCAVGGGALASAAAFTTKCHHPVENKADWAKIKKSLIELYEDEDALNPSIDAAEGSKGGGGYVRSWFTRRPHPNVLGGRTSRGRMLPLRHLCFAVPRNARGPLSSKEGTPTHARWRL